MFSLSLLTSKNARDLQIKVEKLKCLFNYFERVVTNETEYQKKERVVSFERQSIQINNNLWEESTKCLTNIHVSDGAMEEGNRGFSEVDIANKLIGGVSSAPAAFRKRSNF